MSLNGSSLGFEDFLGINTRREDHGGDQEEESIEEDVPVGENGTTDSYGSVPMSRNSHGRVVSGMDARSFPIDASGSWSAQDSNMGTILQRWISTHEPSITYDGVSAAMDPLNISDSLWGWDAIDQPESEGSIPFSTDIAWSAGATTKDFMSYSPNRAINSPRYVAIHSMASTFLTHIVLLGLAGRPWSNRMAVSMEITLPTTNQDFMMACIKVTDATVMEALTTRIHPVSIHCIRRPLQVQMAFIIARGRRILPAITSQRS
jgi:hypothetical protein